LLFQSKKIDLIGVISSKAHQSEPFIAFPDAAVA